MTHRHLLLKLLNFLASLTKPLRTDRRTFHSKAGIVSKSEPEVQRADFRGNGAHRGRRKLLPPFLVPRANVLHGKNRTEENQ